MVINDDVLCSRDSDQVYSGFETHWHFQQSNGLLVTVLTYSPCKVLRRGVTVLLLSADFHSGSSVVRITSCSSMHVLVRSFPIGQNRSHFLAYFRTTRQGVPKHLAVANILHGEPLTSCLDTVLHIDAGFGSDNMHIVSFKPQRISSADIGYSVIYHMLLRLMSLCRAQWLLTYSLYERLQSNDGLIRGDFVASFEHVQKREFARSLECSVLYAVDGVRHQRRRVELG